MKIAGSAEKQVLALAQDWVTLPKLYPQILALRATIYNAVRRMVDRGQMEWRYRADGNGVEYRAVQAGRRIEYAEPPGMTFRPLAECLGGFTYRSQA